ncbi:AbrB family transcriptional regulator [Bacillus sp. FJAT-42376]|uniref:AbrB family transcriptional regulator n=1 Tax=Bacillus sp. FJAT-42376 TaxID=2014076 RepID=UPI000F4E1534|nr:AbrB family transcriptional regulator [Bacillus sp. FJAT-42376]AZB44040.1 AbrB family transcriptional regulator [Bacillus sp. FJAT-42376]
MQNKKWFSFLLTLLYAVAGGILFQLIHMPIPWLIGSMVFVLAGSKVYQPVQLHWPQQIRNTGMIIIGYTIGLSFTMEALQQIGQQLPSMILLTALLLLFSSIIAFTISRLSGISFPTALMGSIPGGLSQIVTLAEETKGIDITAVTFLQVSRLMMIVFFVPLIVFSPFISQPGSNPLGPAVNHPASWDKLFPHIWVFAFICIAAALIGKKAKLPTAFLLGPMIVTIILNLSGYDGPPLPQGMLNLSQLMIGAYIGLMLKPENLKNKGKMVILSFMSGTLLIAGSIGLSILLTALHPVNFVSAFLSLSPGGMDQMALIAREVNADLSIVVCYQLFRILFIFLAVPPLIRVIFRTILKSSLASEASKSNEQKTS